MQGLVILDTNYCKDINPHLPADVSLQSSEEYVQHRCLLGVTEGADEVGGEGGFECVGLLTSELYIVLI